MSYVDHERQMALDVACKYCNEIVDILYNPNIDVRELMIADDKLGYIHDTIAREIRIRTIDQLRKKP